MTVWETARSLNEGPPGLRWAELNRGCSVFLPVTGDSQAFCGAPQDETKGAENPWMKRTSRL